MEMKGKGATLHPTTTCHLWFCEVSLSPLLWFPFSPADPSQPTTEASPGIFPKKPATFHPQMCLAPDLSLSLPPPLD